MPAAGEISSLGRRGGPVRVSSQAMQAIAKSVRRQVDVLNRRGVNASGQRFRQLVDAGDYRGAGGIAHRRMMKRLKSVDFRTLQNDPILFASGRIYPPPGARPSRGFSYRVPDIQYGPAGRPDYRAWDFKGEGGGWPYGDPTGQFADVLDWTGSMPTPLFYHW